MADCLGRFLPSRRMWTTLPRSVKFALYVRLSVQSLFLLPVFFMGTMSWSYAERYSGISAAITWLFFSAIVIATVLGIVLCSLNPELNPRVQREYPRLFTWGLVFTLCLWGIGCLVGVAYGYQLGFELCFSAAIILCLGYFPFLSRPWILTVILVVFTAVACLVVPAGSLSSDFSFLAVISLLWLPLFSFATLSSAWAIRLIIEAERSAELQRHLILTEERLRFAQEMHDTVGQRLAAINIKVELALALAQRDDERFLSELSGLRDLTAHTVSEMHSVVQGYRGIDLASEIEGARCLLRSGGIDLSVIGHPDDLAEPYREVAAWVVREAATNILRHSEATRATLRIDATSLTVSNNNPRVPRNPLRTGGIDVLRRRAAHHGMLLLTDATETEFRVKLLVHREKEKES